MSGRATDRALQAAQDLIAEAKEVSVITMSAAPLTEISDAQRKLAERAARTALELATALVAVAEDAARWRALMSSQRVRVIGSAGLVDPASGELRAPADGYVHIGIELWSLHNAPHPSKDFPQDRCREQLTFYADFLRLWPPVERPPIPAGVYYRAESDNFYDMTANVGMGMGFWQTWRNRKHEFPTERGAAT